MANVEETVRKRLKEYMDSKGYLATDGKLMADKRCYIWTALSAGTEDPTLLKLVRVPRGYLLGGVSVNVLNHDIDSGDYNNLLFQKRLILTLAETVAERKEILSEASIRDVTVHGMDFRAPSHFSVVYSTPQKGSLVSVKSIDHLVEAVREFDVAVHNEELIKRFNEQTLDFLKKQAESFLSKKKRL